jgi:hypothetical protein
MGLIKNVNGANVSIATINGYTKENVIKAKRYLKEIGNDRRNFPIERLVEMYNEIKGTNEKAVGCKPCQATKYFNGIQNYAYFGELTLVNNNKCTKDELDIDKIDAEPIVEEVVEEEKVKEDIKERMAKVREAKKAKKENKDD